MKAKNTEHPRSAGVLMPVTMLHGAFGIGVLGVEAKEFIDFLYARGFHAWQVLPLEQTCYCFSPYRSISAFAGEPMLIDPRILVDMGLISSDELFNRIEGVNWSAVDYELVRNKQRTLLRTAYYRLNGKKPYADFNPFWLDDYALYMAISSQNNYYPWFMWDDKGLRARDPDALAKARIDLHDEIDVLDLREAFDNLPEELETLEELAAFDGLAEIHELDDRGSLEDLIKRDDFEDDMD